MSYSTVLRRLMAQQGLVVGDVVRMSKLHERTVKAVLRGNTMPHARTLHRLAAGLGVDAAEFFRPSPLELVRNADAELPVGTISKVAEVLASEHGDLLTALIEVIHSRIDSGAGNGTRSSQDSVRGRRLHSHVQRPAREESASTT